jgi:hypothetical protein
LSLLGAPARHDEVIGRAWIKKKGGCGLGTTLDEQILKPGAFNMEQLVEGKPNQPSGDDRNGCAE